MEEPISRDSEGFSTCRVLWRLVAVVCLGLSTLQGYASASCPPAKPGSDLAKVLELYTKGGGPTTPEKIALALEELTMKGILSPFMILPPSGPAPLRVEFRWFSYPVQNPVRIEFDADGDGKPERIEQQYESLDSPTHTYNKPGQYQFTVRIHNSTGQVSTTYKTPVRVLALKAFDAELRGQWTALKQALLKNDISSALECINTAYRSEYQVRLTDIARGGPKRINEIFRDLELFERRSMSVKYLREVPQGWMEVLFEPETDGFWRISSF